MNFEKLTEINERLASIPVKGKNYVQVNERIKGFRELCPDGSICTEIVSLENGVVTMRAIVSDETGRVLGTGFAQEKETSSYINKTSFIENCETSAVGRALGMLGIGIDGSMASAEEVANAIMNQNMNENTLPTKDGKVTKEQLKNLRSELIRVKADEKEFCALFKAEKLEDLTQAQVIASINKLSKRKDGEGVK